MQQWKEAQEVPFPGNTRDAHIQGAVVTGAFGATLLSLTFFCVLITGPQFAHQSVN